MGPAVSTIVGGAGLNVNPAACPCGCLKQKVADGGIAATSSAQQNRPVSVCVEPSAQFGADLSTAPRRPTMPIPHLRAVRSLLDQDLRDQRNTDPCSDQQFTRFIPTPFGHSTYRLRLCLRRPPPRKLGELRNRQIRAFPKP